MELLLFFLSTTLYKKSKSLLKKKKKRRWSCLSFISCKLCYEANVSYVINICNVYYYKLINVKPSVQPCHICFCMDGQLDMCAHTALYKGQRGTGPGHGTFGHKHGHNAAAHHICSQKTKREELQWITSRHFIALQYNLLVTEKFLCEMFQSLCM